MSQTAPGIKPFSVYLKDRTVNNHTTTEMSLEAGNIHTMDRSFPLTPERQTSVPQPKPPDDRTLDVSSTSLRERRGRHSAISVGSAQPLSVFAESTFSPFTVEARNAFEALLVTKVESAKESQSIPTCRSAQLSRRSSLRYEHSESPLSLKKSSTTPRRAPPVPSVIGSFNVAVTPTKKARMDLLTALACIPPEETSHITADFATLCETSVPEASQHPSFAVDPFDHVSEAPFLLSTTPSYRIHSCDYKRISADRGSFSKQRAERQFSLLNPASSPVISPGSRNAFLSLDESPFITSALTPRTVSSKSSHSHLTPSSIDIPKTTNSNEITSSTKSRFRDFSNRLRSIPTVERLNVRASIPSPEISPTSPRSRRKSLERYLRVITSSAASDHTRFDLYPAHPLTGRGWYHRNLKCTNCSDAACTVCKRSCCAYKAAALALDNYAEGNDRQAEARARAQHIIESISRLYPYGRETNTFLVCTQDEPRHLCMDDGDFHSTASTITVLDSRDEKIRGCGRVVCPNCCSQCPEDVCMDIQCRRCKPDMFEECYWHKDGVLKA